MTNLKVPLQNARGLEEDVMPGGGAGCAAAACSLVVVKAVY